jgi:phosphate transport system permease protein
MISARGSERIANAVMWVSGLVAVLILFVLIGYILVQGIGMVSPKFLLESPQAGGREGGIFPMIVSTLSLVAVGTLVAVPLGVGGAIYLTEYTRETYIARIIRSGIEWLAGVPSVVFGLFGFAFFVIYLGFGFSLLSGGLIVACMILPTIIRTAEEAIKAVPQSYRDGSSALGATKWQTTWKVIMPSAMPGILTGIILGMGRIAGETAAIMLTVGGSLLMPTSLFDSIRPMSLHLYILATEGLSIERAFGTATILILTVLIMNLTARLISIRYLRKMGVSG